MAETNAQKIIRILLQPFNTLERASQQVHTMRFIDNATGQTLTLLGKIVGQEREGVTDDDLFRRYVKARVATNKSNGLPEDMYDITALIVTEEGVEFTLDNQGNACFVMRLHELEIEWPIVDVLIKFLRRAVDGGVRVIVEWTLTPPAETFAFAAVDGSDPAEGIGFESYDQLTGGAWASAIE